MAYKARIKPPGKTQAERDRIALGRIESYMDGLLDGHMKCPSCAKDMDIKDLPNSTVTLLRARYDKLRPSLSAVEQTNVNPADQATESQLINQLVSIIQARPDVLDTLIAMRQKASEAQDSHTSVVTH